MLDYIEKAILATDISKYLKVRSEYQELVEKDTFDWRSENHRNILRAMLMTACDLSSIIRPWDVQKRVAETVYTEFHQQGEEERKIGHEPAELFDSSNTSKLPKMQLGFIDFIFKPVYKSLKAHFPDLGFMSDTLESNRKNWNMLVDEGDFVMESNHDGKRCPCSLRTSILLETNLQVSEPLATDIPTHQQRLATSNIEEIDDNAEEEINTESTRGNKKPKKQQNKSTTCVIT